MLQHNKVAAHYQPRPMIPTTNRDKVHELSSDDDSDVRFINGNKVPRFPPPPGTPIQSMTTSIYRQAYDRSKQSGPTPIPVPSNPPRPKPQTKPVQSAPPADDGDGEAFVLNVPHEHEVPVSAEEAQRHMHELLSGALGELKLDDVDLSKATVDGFRDGITLMPHQIQGRAWMGERESKKKFGGILADVSPLAFLSRLSLTTRLSQCRM